jgi:ribosomal protein S24E
MEKLSVKENPLFSRREIEVKIRAEISPRIQEATELIAEEFSSSSESIKIKKIKGKFGSKDFIVKANIYASKEEKEKIEPKSRKEKTETAKLGGGNQ